MVGRDGARSAGRHRRRGRLDRRAAPEHGFRDPGWTAVVLGGYALSIWLLAVVVREMPVSVAYAVWSGLGTAGIALVGFAFLDEPLGLVKAGALALVIIGVVVLNLQGGH